MPTTIYIGEVSRAVTAADIQIANCHTPNRSPNQTSSIMAVNKCCVTGFQWGGTPTGSESTLANNPTYVRGSNPDVAVLLVADLFGWKFPNLRLLADHYAREINATVYLPDL